MGGHVHCRLFTSKAQNQTFAKCGDLVFSEDEWQEVRKKLAANGVVEFLEEENQEKDERPVRFDKVKTGVLLLQDLYQDLSSEYGLTWKEIETLHNTISVDDLFGNANA